jgi:dynein light chain LC8-type
MLRGEKRYFREMAEYIKKEFDAKFKGTWHVIVGKHLSLA